MLDTQTKPRAQLLKIESAGIRRFFITLAEHPVLFVAPLFVFVAAILGMTANKDVYRSSALLWFEAGALTDHGRVNFKEISSRKTSLANSLLIGQPIRDILETVWPDANEEKDPLRYNRLLSLLRGSGGIQLETSRDSPQSLTVAYRSSDPDLAYKITRAAVDVLLKLNRDKKAAGSQSRIDFLRKELEIYSTKLKENQDRIAAIRSSLPEDSQNSFQATQSTSSVEEPLDKLKTRLALAEKNMSRLMQELEDIEAGKMSGTEQTFSPPNFEEDPTIKQLTRLILEKEQQLSRLEAEGYLSAHPKLKGTMLELENLRRSKDRRYEQLVSSGPSDPKSSPEQRAAVARTQKLLQAKRLEVEELKDRIKLMSEQQAKPPEASETPIQKATDDTEISRRRELVRELEAEKANLDQKQNALRAALDEANQAKRETEEDGGLNILVNEEPFRPNAPVPRALAPLLLLASVFSFAVSVGIIVLISMLDTSISSTLELQALTKIQILGQVDRIFTIKEREEQRRKLRRALARLCAVTFASFSIAWILS